MLARLIFSTWNSQHSVRGLEYTYCVVTGECHCRVVETLRLTSSESSRSLGGIRVPHHAGSRSRSGLEEEDEHYISATGIHSLGYVAHKYYRNHSDTNRRGTLPAPTAGSFFPRLLMLYSAEVRSTLAFWWSLLDEYVCSANVLGILYEVLSMISQVQLVRESIYIGIPANVDLRCPVFSALRVYALCRPSRWGYVLAAITFLLAFMPVAADIVSRPILYASARTQSVHRPNKRIRCTI